jgi:hypothetical protein
MLPIAVFHDRLTFLISFTENNYQEASCQQFIELLKECCRKWGSASVSCSGIDTQKTPSQTETAPVCSVPPKVSYFFNFIMFS